MGEIGGAGAGGSDLMLVVAAVLVVVGLGFKAGYVPGHFWIPDVYQGATMPIAAFLSIVPKIAAVLALARLVDALQGGALDLAPLIAGISAVTMTWGNIAAFVQTDIAGCSATRPSPRRAICCSAWWRCRVPAWRCRACFTTSRPISPQTSARSP